MGPLRGSQPVLGGLQPWKYDRFVQYAEENWRAFDSPLRAEPGEMGRRSPALLRESLPHFRYLKSLRWEMGGTGGGEGSQETESGRSLPPADTPSGEPSCSTGEFPQNNTEMKRFARRKGKGPTGAFPGGKDQAERNPYLPKKRAEGIRSVVSSAVIVSCFPYPSLAFLPGPALCPPLLPGPGGPYSTAVQWRAHC